MNVFLWTITLLGVAEMATTAYYALKGAVPARTASGMAWNAALMLGMGMWAFWLLVNQ